MSNLIKKLKFYLVLPQIEDYVAGECVRVLYSNMTMLLINTSIITALTLYVFWGTVGNEFLLAWGVGMFAVIMMRMMLVFVYTHIKPSDKESFRWGSYFAATSFISGWIWCAGIILFWDPSTLLQKTYLVLVLLGTAAGSMSLTSIWSPGYYLFILPMLTTLVACLFLQGSTEWIGMGILGTAYSISLLRLGLNNFENFIKTLRLQSENVELIDKLREQKDRAEHAARAKTQFLASASHDLRQPVHALALFADALSHEVTTPKGQNLMTNLSRSVESIDELLTSLLDISKLDAGTVKVNAIDIELNPIFQKVINEFSAEAEKKGLTLRVRETCLTVHSDPVLLGNIVRNLVSNALRYTKQGGILVGCRSHKGEASIEIWDTGLGIPEAEREKIFAEFYQLNNPERDRGKGLGLGLAICQRTCELLHHRIEVYSRPRRGSVFKVKTQLCKLKVSGETAVRPVQQVVLENPLILVVDDEINILNAMDAVLSTWGCEVITAGSGKEAIEKITHHAERRPDLIICDYRLREGETGTEVISKLHEEMNQQIPAIIMTGDTAPDSIRQTQASGHALLHKPVKPMELQKTIQDLIGASRSA
ncbi:MAG: response regulator [Gammaproteobacteria bacterium]|nr:response regulator [Gammaproteobacteria bacterium]